MMEFYGFQKTFFSILKKFHCQNKNKDRLIVYNKGTITKCAVFFVKLILLLTSLFLTLNTFVQFQKREKRSWKSDTFGKVTG